MHRKPSSALLLAVALTALSGLSARVRADDFAGNASGVFSNPTPDGANPDIRYTSPNGPNSMITWGTAATSSNPAATSSSLTIDANPFSGNLNQEFLITGLDYHNGTIVLGTGITSVTLTERLNFTTPSGLVGDKDFDFVLQTISTPNNTGTQQGDADYLQLVSNSSVQTYVIGNTTYRLSITRFTSDANSFVDPNFPNRFYVFEESTGHASIYGRLDATTITPPPPAAVPEPVFYQMSALFTLGGASLVLRRRK